MRQVTTTERRTTGGLVSAITESADIMDAPAWARAILATFAGHGHRLLVRVFGSRDVRLSCRDCSAAALLHQGSQVTIGGEPRLWRPCDGFAS